MKKNKTKIHVRALVPKGKPRRMNKVALLFSYGGEIYDNSYFYYYCGERQDLWPCSENPPHKKFPGKKSTLVQPVEEKWVNQEM